MLALKNQDFKRRGEETSDEDDVIDDDTISMDSVASFWDPCKQRFEAVFIESKRGANKPFQDDIVKWINKCRSAQEFIEENDEIQHKLCAGTGQEDMQCSKSILFLDCDAWKDIRIERLIDISSLQHKTVCPPHIRIVDHTRALWMQHILDQLGLIRSQLGGVVEKYRIYYWKRSLQENASFGHIYSETNLFEVSYYEEENILFYYLSFERVTAEVIRYYADHLAELLDMGAHGFNRVMIYTIFSWIKLQWRQRIFVVIKCK